MDVKRQLMVQLRLRRFVLQHNQTTRKHERLTKRQLTHEIMDLLRVHAVHQAAAGWPGALTRRREFRFRRDLVAPTDIAFSLNRDRPDDLTQLCIDRHGRPYFWKITEYEDGWVRLGLMRLPLHTLGLLVQDLKNTYEPSLEM